MVIKKHPVQKKNKKKLQNPPVIFLVVSGSNSVKNIWTTIARLCY